jgi:hypothetical protein
MWIFGRQEMKILSTVSSMGVVKPSAISVDTGSDIHAFLSIHTSRCNLCHTEK